MLKDTLGNLLIFHSLNHNDEYISLDTYISEKKKDNKYIYYASGENLDAIKLLPQIEKYKKEEIDVLLLDQKVDEFMIMMMRDFNNVEFKSISQESSDDLSKEEQEKIDKLSADNKRLLDNIKAGLEGKVDDVIISSKLVDAPVCFSTKEGMSLEMEKTLNEEFGEDDKDKAKAIKVLEINPEHQLFQALVAIQDNDELVKEYASILYDEAMLLEGGDIENKGEFVKKLNALLLKALEK